MRTAEEFGKGFHARTQMFYASVSYWLHKERPADITARVKELPNKYDLLSFIDGTHFHASFGHLDGLLRLYVEPGHREGHALGLRRVPGVARQLGTVELCEEFGRGDCTPGVLDDLRDFVPVGIVVELHANPTSTAHIGRDEKPLGVAGDV